ncbi:hypothetical protein [Lonepinella sp. BR2474]|uniref:hypothetical protein n=1 Tax=Lonepinella sp. BR2474 TaxID=3434548 RepID=UPI003F6E3003
MEKFIKKHNRLQVGIWVTKHHYELVWLESDKNAKKTPHFCRVTHLAITDIRTTLYEKLPAHMTTPRPLSIDWVTPCLPHQVWYKNLLLQEQLAESECKQQCRYTIEKELPIPLDELWFDYVTTPLKQGLRLDIFAVKREVAQGLLTHFLPLKIKVLDTMTGCLYRAFRYVLNSTPSAQSLYIYQDTQFTLLFRQTQQEWQILSQSKQADLTELYQQFTQRYEQPIDKILYYSTLPDYHFSVPHQRVTSDIPLIPLGAALWKTGWQMD